MVKVKVKLPQAFDDSTGLQYVSVHAGGSEVVRATLSAVDGETRVLVQPSDAGWEVDEKSGELVGALPSKNYIRAKFAYVTAVGATAYQEVVEPIDTEDDNVVSFQFVANIAPAVVVDVVAEDDLSDEHPNIDPTADQGKIADSDEKSSADVVDEKKDEKPKTGFESFKLTAHELSILTKHGCDTFEKAAKYFAEQGSFEPMSGFSEKSGNAVAVKLGLKS